MCLINIKRAINMRAFPKAYANVSSTRTYVRTAEKFDFPISLVPKKLALECFIYFSFSADEPLSKCYFHCQLYGILILVNALKPTSWSEIYHICCFCGCCCYARVYICVCVYVCILAAVRQNFGPLPKRPNECHSTGNFSVDVCKWAAPKSMLTGFKCVQRVHNFVAVCESGKWSMKCRLCVL